MTAPSIPTDLRDAHRARWQQLLGARYDTWHALLVRAVHPLAFGSFLLTSVAITYVIGAIVLEVGDSDVAGIAFTGIVALATAVIAAFTFVLTTARAVIALVLLASWSTALLLIDKIDSALLWAVWLSAAASVALQVVLLAWVLPRRWRAGLVHRMALPAVGTLVGAVPVILALRALRDDDDAQALALAQVAFIATAVVLVVLLALHLLVRRGERKVLRAFALRHSIGRANVNDSVGASVWQLSQLLPTWAWHAGPYKGKVDGRQVAVVSGTTSSRSPDVSSIHATLLSVTTRTKGRDAWIRRRDRSYDDVLASGNHTRVMTFESLALDADYSIRVDAQADELDVWRTFTPEVLAQLEAGLRGAQACRIDNIVSVWMAGSVVDADELDAMLELATHLATVFEGIDERVDNAVPMTT